MAEANKTTEVIQGYMELWQWSIGAWGAQAQAYADVIAQPGYSPASLADLVTDGAKLANETFVRGFVEALDMMAIYGSNMGQPTFKMSDAYPTAVSTGQRKLARAGTWSTNGGDDPLDPAVPVSFLPAILLDGVAEFRVTIDSSKVNVPGVYDGSVNVIDASGAVIETVHVVIEL